MEHNCERHPFEVAEGVCRSCRGSFCPDCLLYPFGPEDQPFCKPCAISAGGVRSTAANPRRAPAVKPKAKARSRGLLARLRLSSGSDGDDPEQLSPEELLAREAAEAREMLDAQRLPSEPEEELEPEPPPTPNIAPPGGADTRELNHRRLPDEIAGGLDLRGAADPASPDPASPDPADTEDVPTAESRFAQRRPDPASQGGSAPAGGPPADGPAQPPPPDTPHPADAPPAPEPVTAPPPALPATPAAPEPAAAIDAPSPAPAGPAPVVTTGAQTADGTPLFTTGPPSDEGRPGDADGEAAEPAPQQPLPTAVGASEDPFPDDETGELLRRIADIRGG